jgi:anaerobic ribonucleoside-triphosphate reductase
MEEIKNQEEKIICHDCKKEIKAEDGEIKAEDGEIKDGFALVYDDGGEKISVYKCKECFEKNPSLNNFKKCEVYSRIVGYIRPVQQWNEGKPQEYKDRTEFKTE